MNKPLTLIRKHAIYVSYASCKSYNCMHFISSHGKYLDHDNMDEMSHCSLNNIIININETLHILRQTRRLVDLHISEYFPHISLSTVDRLPCGVTRQFSLIIFTYVRKIPQQETWPRVQIRSGNSLWALVLKTLPWDLKFALHLTMHCL